MITSCTYHVYNSEPRAMTLCALCDKFYIPYTPACLIHCRVNFSTTDDYCSIFIHSMWIFTTSDIRILHNIFWKLWHACINRFMRRYSNYTNYYIQKSQIPCSGTHNFTTDWLMSLFETLDEIWIQDESWMTDEVPEPGRKMDLGWTLDGPWMTLDDSRMDHRWQIDITEEDQCVLWQ